MICKDCIYYDVCKDLADALEMEGCICNHHFHFKDKSHFIELPCKVGTELFLSDCIMHHHRLKEYKFIGERVVMIIECFEFQRTCKRFVDEHFGKTVFLTKEEAERALKELQNDSK